METSPPRKSQRKQKEEKLDVKKEDKQERKTGKGSKQTSDNEESKFRCYLVIRFAVLFVFDE